MKPKPAAALWQMLRDQVAACVKCGACLAFCPLYGQERREGASMRGKIALVQAWLASRGEGQPGGRRREAEDGSGAARDTGVSRRHPWRQRGSPSDIVSVGSPATQETADPRGHSGRHEGPAAIRLGGGPAVPAGDVREALSFCTGCQSCRATCPNGVDTCLVTLLGRLLLPKSALQAWKEWGCSLLARWRWGRRVLGRLLVGPAAPGIPLRPRMVEQNARLMDRGGAVVLVPGFRLARFPHLVEAAADLMSTCLGGERPAVETACCGELALEIPDLEGYSRQLGAWLETMARRDPGRIVVACPHCLEALGRARDLCEASPGEARLLDRVTDLYSWLREAGFRPVAQEAPPAILLDVCANRKDKGMSRAARELLARCRPNGVGEPPVTGGGCTCRNGFGMRHPVVARTLRKRVAGGGRERGRPLCDARNRRFAPPSVAARGHFRRRVGRGELVTVCASCLPVWNRDQSGRVVHLIEVLAGLEGGRPRPRVRNGGRLDA